MKTEKIYQYLEAYKKLLRSRTPYEEAYKWEVLKNFQDNWDVEAPDFAEMYSRSLASNMSRRLWRETGYEPRQRMLEFIPLQPDWVRHLFRDLFDEEKSLDARIGRFVFGCDELMAEYRQQNPTSNETSHYHEDYRMISLYLGLRHPQAYAPYDLDTFRNILVKLEGRDIPLAHDLPRYIKLLRILEKFITKDEELLEAHRNKIRGNSFYKGPTLMLVQDFCWCCTQPRYRIEQFF